VLVLQRIDGLSRQRSPWPFGAHFCTEGLVMKFADLRLAEPILRAVDSAGYVTATPIQAQAIPHALEGKDVLGCAQTGTGKTAAFALPILQKLSESGRAAGFNLHVPERASSKANGPKPARRPRALILAPTRELATQIADDFRTYGKFLHVRQTVIFGGVNQNPQVDSLRRGVDVVIATPGRLLDLMQQGHVDLRSIETLVLDEADRMLDMGFIHDIRKVVARIPQQRQTMLFSATMPNEIRKLADSLLRNPVQVQVAPASATADKIDQKVYFVDRNNKPALLAHLVSDLPMTRAIVFTRTKHGADRVVRHLHNRGIRAEAIHGNKSQNARQRALDNFKSNRIPVLVATDIASRGIDVDGVTHVVNYDLTHEPETYVHRIGRTARAGASGSAVSFCDREERPNLKAIESLIRRSIPVATNHPEYPKQAGQPQQQPRPNRQQHQPQGRAPARQQNQSHPQRERQMTHTKASHSPRPRHPLQGTMKRFAHR
jgi:ATP-dependent RNA helicase RhlE